MFASEVSESFLPGRRGLLATVVGIGISVYLVERELEACTHIPVGITPWYLVDDKRWMSSTPRAERMASQLSVRGVKYH